MTFRIRTIDQTAAGREIVREREIAQDSLTIGRAAENDIHLPDLAIEQRHVRVSETASGQLRVEALGTLGFTIDGRSATSATVVPREGAELELGSYRLEFSAEDGANAITIRRGQAQEGRRSEALSGFTLGERAAGKARDGVVDAGSDRARVPGGADLFAPDANPGEAEHRPPRHREYGRELVAGRAERRAPRARKELRSLPRGGVRRRARQRLPGLSHRHRRPCRARRSWSPRAGR